MLIESTSFVDAEIKRNYVCKECDAVFEHGQALGGHMSKRHPGHSKQY